MTVNVNDILDEYHIDSSPTEVKTMQGLLDFAQDYLVNVVDHTSNIQDITTKTSANLVDRCIITIATSLYYDRFYTESGSIPLAVQLMVATIKQLYIEKVGS
ncbi:hypothetical protein LCIT_17130 [Leuconostoc citreum]|uniref:Phage gp6-like head-tail connector protein n=1 Tax=Leuconostoc citreum TaxID=33964 RepID=A0A5A5U071_LEUCI|nr:hypothetical protein [Leuconostoc citreum]GDZ84471.1 hypothetical protein LCIT_17130 [Leuconostoc citreum]